MAHFRQRTPTIEAWKFEGTLDGAPAWIKDRPSQWPKDGGISFEPKSPEGSRILLNTSGGVTKVKVGDYIANEEGVLSARDGLLFESAYEEIAVLTIDEAPEKKPTPTTAKAGADPDNKAADQKDKADGEKKEESGDTADPKTEGSGTKTNPGTAAEAPPAK